MAGIDAAASITALISLSVSIFQGCVEGYKLICTARHADQDLTKFHCLLQWEELRLVEWGRRVNIDGETQNHFLPWQLIRSTLAELRNSFTDLEGLKARYGLEPTSEDGSQTTASDGKRKGIVRLWSHANVETQALRARSATAASAQKLGAVRRFRWVSFDQNKMKDLIMNLTRFNNRLYDVLEAQNQEFIRGALKVLLQDIAARTNFSDDLETVKLLATIDTASSSAIEAAADLKQTRIGVSYDQGPTEKPQSNGPKAKVSKLKPDAIRSIPTSGNRQIAVYKSSKRNINSWILLEWKQISHTKLKRRVETLTLLLEKAVDPAFHTLRCLGYASNETKPESQLALAYAYELMPNDGGDVAPQIVTLHDLLGGTNVSTNRPSLSTRVRYALQISEAVLQLHTAGWLHKSIRSSNVLFTRWPAAPELRGPYMVGFEYSRADNILEMTENPTRRPETDLYRHPNLLKPDRPDFCKAFDLYGLGCVLMEIALWEQLDSMTQRTMNGDDSVWDYYTFCPPDNTMSGLVQDVAFAAGDTFARAVRHCFFPQQEESVEDDDDADSSIANEMEVVRLLKSLQC